MSRRKLFRYEGGSSLTGRPSLKGGVFLDNKSNKSADPVNDAGGPVERPGERGCLEGGRGGEQASRAGILVNANNQCGNRHLRILAHFWNT